MPNHLIFGLVETKAYQGDVTLNPFRFQNFGTNSISMLVNSKSYPAVRYQPDWANNLFMREYRGFNDAIGVKFHNQGSIVTPELFKDGFNLYAFDLTPDGCGNYHIHASDRGHMQLEIGFAASTAKDITCIIYGSMNDEFQLDQDRMAYSSGTIAP
jgi:hypothetical protein